MPPTSPQSGSLDIGTAATLACLYEVTARKPGNVYPGANFDGATTYVAFVTSAIIIGPIVAQAPTAGVGRTVLNGVCATREAVNTNTNLGTLLLLAALAAVPSDIKLDAGISEVLDRLTPVDTRAVYEAIRLADAGGLGREVEADVFSDPPPTLGLTDAMRLAAGRDLVARQYTNNFGDVFGASRSIERGLAQSGKLEDAIVHAYLEQLAATPDSLIQRKCGPAVAAEASTRAARTLNSSSVSDSAYLLALNELNDWLRADGHRRNPGTTADLIAAGLFVLLREGRLNWSSW
ncbi:MAG TPA: triphosphoribosyl-dephospho-CoA synthase [Lacipirellulaceae bacterium]|nr:triphosphoribosyl-dephospho-CoA synthase [Lacipirellulaceae bacterium]